MNTYGLNMYDTCHWSGWICVMCKEKAHESDCVCVREREKLMCASSAAVWMPGACLPR